jgi:hypothetical protein
VAGVLAVSTAHWQEGMGYGDFKLLAAFGAWLGWSMLPLIILLSSLVGAIVGVVMILLARLGRGQPLPLVLIWLLPAGSPCCGARILSVGIWVVMSINIIGLTGGIGSKSAAASHFAALGVPVVDTDVIASADGTWWCCHASHCGNFWSGCGGSERCIGPSAYARAGVC